MATKYIDNIVVNTVSYGTSTEDIQTNDTRTLKITNGEISNIVVDAFLGDLSNGKIVKLSSKGASEGGNIMAFDVTYFINPDNIVSPLVPLQAYPAGISTDIDTTITSEGYLRVVGPEGGWSSLVTII